MLNNNLIIAGSLWFFFGYQHSLFARPFFKKRIRKIFGTKFELHIYPLLYFTSQCAIFLIVYDLIRHLKPHVVFYRVPSELDSLIFLLNRFANLFLIFTVFHFNVSRFTGLSQFFALFSKTEVNETQLQESLNNSYLYRYIRHPMYLGIILVYLTSTTIYTDLFLVNLFSIIIYIEVGSHFEEKSLLQKFGSQYFEYQASTKKYFPFLR